MKKILKRALGVIFALIMIFAVYVIIVSIIAARDKKHPQFIGGYSYSIVATDSMVPTINVGDAIIYKNTNFRRAMSLLEDGEKPIIVFINDQNMYITHRAIRLVNGKIVTQGDNAPSIDLEYVTEDNFVGIVENVLRIAFVGTFILKNRNFLFLGIVLILALILVIEIVKISKDGRKKSKEKLEETNKKELDDLIESERKKIEDELKKELEDKDKKE